MKRPTSKRKALSRQEPGRRRRPRLSPKLGLVAIPQAVGKTVQELTVSNSYDDNGIDIFFEDQTGLSFSFETELKLRVGQTDETSGKWREVRRWSRPKPV